MEIDEAFKEHIAGIFTDLCDLEPMQQRYRTDVLIMEDDEVSLAEFVNSFYSATKIKPDIDLTSIENFIVPPGTSAPESDQHPEIIVPYGPAFLALLGDPNLVSEFNLERHPNPGIRLLVAHFSKDALILDSLSYDRCALVRAGVASNKNSSSRTMERLKDDPFVYVRYLIGEEVPDETEGDEKLIANLELELCICQETEINEAFEEFFGEQQGLEYPPLTVEFEEEIIEFGYWHWATQPFPTRWQDYSLNESVEYLRGPVPDQYSLNHAGHGINSYSINFRHVLGNIAIFAQSPYGGGYMSEGVQERDWDELQLRLTTILLDHVQINVGIKNEIRIRKFLIVYSRFRIGDEPELWQNFEGEWKKVESIWTWEDLVEYLRVHNV